MTRSRHLPRRIVVTGGPGFGKSTVLDILAADGFTCVPDAPRELILEQQGLEDAILPQTDFVGFADLVLERMIRQYREMNEGTVLYDRALPDLPAYLFHAGFPVPEAYRQALQDFRYDGPVFFFPPWEEIYGVDGVRYETFAQAVAIGELIRRSYQAEGYEVIDVPKTPVTERVGFLLGQLAR